MATPAPSSSFECSHGNWPWFAISKKIWKPYSARRRLGEIPLSALRTLLLLGLCCGFAAEAFSQNPRAARSVHLWYEAPESIAFYNEATVEKSSTASYFMACGFSKGYFGIQELGNKKKVVLFSVWEPGKQNNPNTTPEQRRVKTISSGKGVRVKRFGGEGTGGQSFFDYDWKVGETIRFVVFARKEQGSERTQYAGYVFLPRLGRWQHMATFSTLANGHLLRGYYSFVEDFRRDGKSPHENRRASFGNGWVMTGEKKWLPLTRTRFTADRNPLLNIDSGTENDRFYLATGGEIENENTKLNGSQSLAEAERKPPLDLPAPLGIEASKWPRRIRVLAYNIKHGQGNDGKVDLARAAQVIRRLNPDLVALQEIDYKTQRTKQVDQAKVLGELTGLNHSFGSFFNYQKGKYGMAMLSRSDLKAVKNLRLPDGAEPRTSLYALTKPPRLNATIAFASIHFYATAEQRQAQASKLLEYLAKEKRPVIIAGDFNSKPDSDVIKLFQDDWTIPNKGTDRFTFSSDRPRTEIDFIMFRPKKAFKVIEIDVIDEPVISDHRPVVLELEVQVQPSRN